MCQAVVTVPPVPGALYITSAEAARSFKEAQDTKVLGVTMRGESACLYCNRLHSHDTCPGCGAPRESMNHE